MKRSLIDGNVDDHDDCDNQSSLDKASGCGDSNVESPHELKGVSSQSSDAGGRVTSTAESDTAHQGDLSSTSTPEKVTKSMEVIQFIGIGDINGGLHMYRFGPDFGVQADVGAARRNAEGIESARQVNHDGHHLTELF
jgi:hypothetical protein